ncbi:MAG: FKBP-type peptidyl-prolyl cis-trans isomerase [Prevotellaceae bacterium]|jgi:FKBP-type peptidyl-prolyl cis-trans isomerase 2|nr:FKBP-type peptidyl-prolyl cis-trans isomerase [Prevotellaceae bacterium]
MHKFFQLRLLLLVALLLSGCAKEKSESAREWEQRQIDAYLTLYYPDLVDSLHTSGIYILNYTPSGGTVQFTGDTSQWVQFDYTGMYLNGTKFMETDSTKAHLLGTFSYTTHYIPVYSQYWSGTMLSGLYAALGKMYVGDVMKVLLPSWMAYGSSGSSSISGNTPIILELTMRGIVDDPKQYELDQVNAIKTADNEFVELLDSTGAVLSGIYIKYVDTVAPTDSTPYLKKGDVPSLKYSGYFLDTFLLDSNVGAVAKKYNRYPSSGSDTSKYSSYLTYTYGSAGELIPAFNAALWHIAPGSTIEVIFTSTWGYGSTGYMSGAPQIYPYTPLRYKIYFDSE